MTDHCVSASPSSSSIVSVFNGHKITEQRNELQTSGWMVGTAAAVAHGALAAARGAALRLGPVSPRTGYEQSP